MKLTTRTTPAVIHTFATDKEYQAYISTFAEDTLWKTIGSAEKGFRVGFNKFDITFKQNKVVGSKYQRKIRNS